MGDFNGRTGNKLNDNIVGQHGEDVENDNGQRLIDICELFSLRILNGYFQHKNIHKYTWTRPTMGQKSIIDYIINKQVSTVTPTNVRVHRGAECGSDHFLVKGNLYFEYKPKNEPKIKEEEGSKLIQKHYNLDSLKDDGTSFLYKIRLAQKLQDDITGDTNNRYEKLKKHILQAAGEALGIRKKGNYHKNNIWLHERLEQLIQEKKKAYNQWLVTQDRDDRKEYNRLKYLVKKETTKAKNTCWENKCSQISSLLGSSRSRESWKCINSLRTDNREQKKIEIIGMTKWVEHYKDLLTENRNEYILHDANNDVKRNGNIRKISTEEINEALKCMKNNKSAGPGGVPIELVKHAPSQALEILRGIFNDVLNGDKLPDEWNKSYISSIYKKGNKKDCGNYRGIAVSSSIGRLYGRIIKKRIEEEIEEIEIQSGFRPGRSCVDNLFSMKQIMEKCTARNKELHLVFIDLKKAYDSVPHIKLWKAMDKENINGQLIEAVKEIYKDANSEIKVGNQLSSPFKTNKGLKQGCPMSPTLFKIYSNQALEKWLRQCKNMGVGLNDESIHTLLFADDQIVLAEDEDDANYMVRKLIDEYKLWGLEINLDKTQYMVVGGQDRDLDLGGTVIRHTKEYKYLGVTITKDGRDELDIRRKIGRGKNIIRQLHPVLWNNHITEKTKKMIYSTIFESCVTYGAEVWVVNKNWQNRLAALEMDFWRRSSRISRNQHIRNEEVKRIMHVEGSILDEIQRKQLLWYGHMKRMPDTRIPRKTFEWMPFQRRKRGRPKTEWKEQIKKGMENRGLSEEDWNDRNIWRMRCEKRHI